MAALCPFAITSILFIFIRLLFLNCCLVFCHPLICLTWDVRKWRFLSSPSALVPQAFQLNTGAVLLQHACVRESCVDVADSESRGLRGPASASVGAPLWCFCCGPIGRTLASKGLEGTTSHSGILVLLYGWPLFSFPNDSASSLPSSISWCSQTSLECFPIRLHRLNFTPKLSSLLFFLIPIYPKEILLGGPSQCQLMGKSLSNSPSLPKSSDVLCKC